MRELLFQLGRIVATPGALDAMETAGVDPAQLIRRHVTGDWGQLGNWDNVTLSPDELRRGALATADDDKLNAYSIIHKSGRVMSSYLVAPGVKVWIITDGLDMPDETYTTFLLPSEY